MMSVGLNHLQRELEETRAHLAEAEEALDAIRNGEVDGLLVAGPEGQHVFTLTGAQEPYRLLIEEMSEGAVTLSREGDILYANQAMTHLLKTRLEQIIGADFISFVSPSSQPAFTELIDASWAGSSCGEVLVRASDGCDIEVRIGLKRVKLEPETVLCGVVTDLTEARKREEQLRLQSAALKAAENAILITDRSGKIVWANPAFSRYTGYSFEEIHGRTPRLLKSGKQDGAFYKEMWETILAGKVWSSTLTNRCKDGTLRHENQTINPIRDANGAITHFVSIKQDLTELERAFAEVQTKSDELAAMTQQLWQASKLATMGELAASIAHELNNPLATVGLRTENLLLQLPDDSAQRKSLEIITQEVDRMAGLVENLLQFSRRSHRQVSTVDVREEIANSLEFVHYHLRNRNIEVVRQFTDPLPTIQADRQHLRQLFLNLLTNAGDAMPEGGTLTVRAYSDKLAEADAVTIEFADTGEGIDVENLKKIWEPFFTTKPEGKGTGLGLAICRRIVEEHGGRIEIQTEAACGVTVRIVFPATANGASSQFRND